MFKKAVDNYFLTRPSGQALIELVLAIAIATVLLGVLTTGMISAREGFTRTGKNLKANLLLQKEIEGLRSVRETGWNSISAPGIYHIEQSGTSWIAVSGTIVEGDFTRGFTVTNVCRTNPTSAPVDCATAGAKADPSIKEVTATISWSFLGTQSVSATFYLSRHFGNQSWSQTTTADFNQGTLNGTLVTNTSGGEIEIDFTPPPPVGCQGHWQAPTVCQTYDSSGTGDGRGVFVAGNYAYMVGNGAGGADFFIFDITDPENISLVGSLDLGATGYDVYVSGNYAFVATSHDNRELTIVDITSKANPTIAGPGYNSPGNQNGYGIFVSGNTAYLSRQGGGGSDFFVLDVTNPLSITLSDSINLGGHGYDVYVSGNYAYLATSNNSRELDIIDISNPSNITRAGSYDTPGKTNARGVFVVGTTAYLTTQSRGDDLYLLNVANPASVSTLSSLELGGNSYSVFVAGTLAFVGTSNTAAEFQVVDISDPNSPLVYGSANLNGLTNSVFTVGDYAYVANADDTAEFQVIKGGDPPIGGGGGCTGNWQAPQVCKTQNTSGADGRDVFVAGNYAYLVSGGNGSDFYIFDISSPESFTLVGSTDLLGQTGFNVFVAGDYAYVATSHDSQELMVVDISNKSSPVVVGSGYDLPDTRNARGINVVGNTAFIVRDGGTGADFFALDVSNPLSISLLDSLNITGSAYNIYVSGNYAYVATKNDSQELQVIDISNPTNISKVGSYNTPGSGANALNIFVRGSTAYLTTVSDVDEFYILDVANPASISLIGSLDLGGNGDGLFVDQNYAFVGTNNGAREFQVIDISTPANPTLYGSADLNGRTYGVWTFGDYAVIANADNVAEFQLIKGGALFSGSFVSSAFDAASAVGFNFLTWTTVLPAGTNVRFQIATNSDGLTWNFSGPDGSATTFYDTPGAIALNAIRAQYLRYRAILSSDSTNVSPVIEDVTVNYSP